MMKVVYRFRSAVTGRYVSAAYAKRYPHNTIRERVTSDGFNNFCKGVPEKARVAAR